MPWRIAERPGQTGFKKEELIARLDQQYGKENWEKAWSLDGQIVDQMMAFQMCEDAYYADSFHHEENWKRLIREAKDIYDMLPEEVDSGLDYRKQHKFTRFHDIAIRRVILRRGWNFQGEQLIQIRYEKEHPNWYSENFDPGKVQFHLPQLIYQPNLVGWWNHNSVEDFYQSNKVIVVKQ
jgi:hypothetical protein